MCKIKVANTGKISFPSRLHRTRGSGLYCLYDRRQTNETNVSAAAIERVATLAIAAISLVFVTTGTCRPHPKTIRDMCEGDGFGEYTNEMMAGAAYFDCSLSACAERKAPTIKCTFNCHNCGMSYRCCRQGLG